MFNLIKTKNILFYHINNNISSHNIFFVQNKIATIQKITWIDFIYNAPEIFLLLVVLLQLILVGTAHFSPKIEGSQNKQTALSLYNLAKNAILVCIIICLLNLIFFSNTYIAFNGYVIVDIYTQVLKLFVLWTTWSILIASTRYFLNHPRHLMEYPALILLNTVFLFVFISSYNLITTFLTLVGFSLNIYVILLNDSFNHSSREAGIKYYYLSTFSSGLILGGVLLIYLFFHTTNFLALTWLLHDMTHFNSFLVKNVILHLSLYFIIFGFFFKLASFPCHFWAPEVYDGSPHPVTAFLVLPVKIATFGLLLRILNYVFLDVYYIWEYIIWMSSFFSMIWGCLGALNEPLIKRFIAYSSINQMGFLFLGLVCGSFEGTRASLIYLLLYTIMNLGFFILFLNTKERKKQRSLTYLSDFNDYAQNNYLYTVTFVVILFSMAGIPPLAGFFGKYYLFLHAFETGHIDLVIIGMITSLIASYYYLRIIKIMWFEYPIKPRFYFKTNFTEFLFFYYVAIEFVLIFFVIWSPILFKCVNWLTATCMNPLTAQLFHPWIS
jgi:NADH-quinone oxidoreductase subunit N